MKFLQNLTLILVFLTSIYSIDNLTPRDDLTKYPVKAYEIPYGMTDPEKWTLVFSDVQLLRQFKLYLEEYLIRINVEGYIPDEFKANMDQMIMRYEIYHPDMISELRVISQVTNESIYSIFLLNFTYEMFAHIDACTSIVYRRKDGQLIHGRNMDYFSFKLLAELSIQFTYYDENNQKIYSTIQNAGYATVTSGMRYNGFSISLNQRNKGVIQENLNSFFKGGFANEYLMRVILRDCTTYNEAVEFIKTHRTIAPSYFILAGLDKNEGILVENYRDQIHATYELTDDIWFLVATNYDQEDEDGDGRRIFAHNNIEQHGQNMTENEVLDEIMMVFPTLHTKTVHTSMYSPSTGYLDQMVWYD